MAPRNRLSTASNILMQLRKVCQHPYLYADDLEDVTAPPEKQHLELTKAAGKLVFLKLLLPKLKQRGHRVLLFSQFKIALDRIEDFLWGEGYKYLRLDGDVQQAVRQKQMDEFNKPDSDVFIFLLTTRAGGVGINLATADTVIIHDPDFNPHQDHQAIARSHRYGQKKRVLVFKLMTENSVEEQIINKGKKKMVLDHLVVQQMGKDTEEGEIDNLLLHGVEALNRPDSETTVRNYTSRDIDDLIDSAEQQADAEAKALAEREKAAEAGDGDGSAEPKNTESMNFSFAKVWESRKGGLQDVPDDEPEQDAEAQENAWQRMLGEAEREREAERARRLAQQKAEERIRRATRAAEKRYYDTLDESPKGKDKKGKGKSKAERKSAGETSDTEFVAPVDAGEDSDTGSEGSAHDVSDLLQDDRPNAVSGLAAGKQKLTKAEKRRLKEATEEKRKALLARQANGVATNGATVPAPLAANGAAGPSSAGPSRSQNASPASTANGASMAVPAPRGLDDARRTLLALLQALNKYVTPEEAKFLWGILARPEVDRSLKHARYIKLAHFVDKKASEERRSAYFMRPNVIANVLWFFDSRQETITPQFLAANRMRQPSQPTLAASSASGSVQPQVAEQVAQAAQIGRSPSAAAMHRPVVNGHAAGAVTPGVLAQPIAQPAAARPHPRAPPPHVYLPPHVHPPPQVPSPPPVDVPRPPRPPSTPIPVAPKQVVNFSSHAAQATSAASPCPTPAATSFKRANSSRIDAAPPSPREQKRATCMWCKSDHELRDCPQLPGLDELRGFQEMITKSDEADADKLEGLEAIERMMQAHQERAGMQAQAKAKGPKRTAGLAVDPIDVDALSDGPPAPKQPRHAISSSAPSGSRSKVHKGCQICMSASDHSAAQCPVVKAGPASIHHALQRFDPGHPLHPVLRTFLAAHAASDPAAPAVPYGITMTANYPTTSMCPFCRTPCGRSVRACAEAHGGRKRLKDRIRLLESEREKVDKRRDDIEARRKQVMLMPRTGPVDGALRGLAKELAALNAEWENPCRELEELFIAYQLWPKGS
ncbi:hypothetical protein Q5752_002370 [Cryptotrichosporon argae]